MGEQYRIAARSKTSEQHNQVEPDVCNVYNSYQAYLSILSQKHYAKCITKFKEIFETQLQSFLQHVRVESTTRHEHFLSNMLTRLDYNDYYSTVLTVSPSPVGPPEGDARGAGR